MEKRDTHLNTPKCPSSLNTGEKKSGDWSLRFWLFLSVRGVLWGRLLKGARTFFFHLHCGICFARISLPSGSRGPPLSLLRGILFSHCLARLEFFLSPWMAVWTFVPRLNSYRNAFHANSVWSTWRKPRRRRTEKSRDWSSLELRLQLLLVGGTMKGVGSCKSSLASFVFLFGLLSGHWRSGGLKSL